MVNISPKTLTFITTYQCTAACKECCFECTPNITGKLSFEDIVEVVDKSLEQFLDIELVVFTGGECFILKDDLFKAIKYCSERNLKTRCVTNGYWAKRKSIAEEYASRLFDSGITEINISTGSDHQEWIKEDTIVNAAVSLVKKDIFTLVTIEKDGEKSSCVLSLKNRPEIINLLKNNSSLFTLRSNVWMPFFRDSEQRGDTYLDLAKEGCGQVFNNIVITPKKEVSACCGLTLEHIPEMKLGDTNDLSCYANEQENDFLKIWIHTEGPYKIIQRLMGVDTEKLKGVVHNCQACAILHQDKDVIKNLKKNYHHYITSVYHQYHLKQSMR